MAYQDSESGMTSGSPIELYEFSGTYNTYRMTSSLKEIISNGATFKPTAIQRNRLKVATQDSDDAVLEIDLPFDHPMMKEYAYQNAPPNLSVRILRAHRTDHNDTILLWAGRVTAFSVEGRLGKLRVPSVFGYLLEGNTPNPRYQAPCNHILYDERCAVDPGLHQHLTKILSIEGNNLRLQSLPFLENEASGGMVVSSSGEGRMVIRNLGDSVTLSYSFSRLKIGDDIIIRKGCDHSFEGHCKTRFNNGPRFGGFPLVPDRNPFTSSLK